MKSHIITGNNIDVLKTYPDNHFDSVVTDPPYGIDFLGKTWDANTGALETYQQCLRVLKPGGYLLAFSAARTYHHLAVTVEQAGFEIRDQIMWIYSSGFPKSQDVGKNIQRAIGVEQYEEVAVDTTQNSGFGMTDHARVRAGEEWSTKATTVKKVVVTDPVAKQWEGWGTALKPAHEPIVMARKPTKLSFAENVQQWGMGAVNIDAGRVPVEGTDTRGGGANGWDRVEFGQAEPNKTDGEGYTPNSAGRFPSNVIGEIEEPYQKYFYCPKVGRAERHVGFDTTNIPTDPSGYQGTSNGGNYLEKKQNQSGEKGNNHPTVKPIELMKYLIRLVTPAGGHVLDPFNGSGSTGCAAVELDYEYTGIELDPKYAAIAEKRIQAWYEQTHATTFGRLFE